jgi:hypothetical protein
MFNIDEMGFTLQNVRALCDTGKSFKVNDGSTTGEKGLGFKSVFTIANIVHIWSGFWSFRFENLTEDGTGMVIPLWTKQRGKFIQYRGTRIRLEFSDTRASMLKELIAHLEGLPKTIVFALRQISHVNVVLENVCGRNDSASFRLKSDQDKTRFQVESKVVGKFRAHYSHPAYFRCFREEHTGLPEHKLRSSDSTIIKVAWEIDGKETPVVPQEGQRVFAFLPVQRIQQLPVSPCSLT